MGYYPPGDNEDWLFMFCPVSDDKCPTKVRKASYWVHHMCGGKLKIGTSTYITCSDCNKSYIWTSWRFRCSHSQHDFEKVDEVKDIIRALSAFVNIEHTISIKRDVVLEIIENIARNARKR